MQGLLSVEWAPIQQNFYDYLSSRRTGSKWARGLINKLHGMHQGMWEDRNKVNNSPDNVTFVDTFETLNDTIRTEYRRGRESVLPAEHFLFRQSLKFLIKTTPTHRQWWIDTVQLSQRRKNRREQSNSMDASRRIMAAFLSGDKK